MPHSDSAATLRIVGSDQSCHEPVALVEADDAGGRGRCWWERGRCWWEKMMLVGENDAGGRRRGWWEKMMLVGKDDVGGRR